MSWQNIENAPKSEKQILTYRKSLPTLQAANGGAWFQTSFWSESFNCWVGWPKDKQPTHWMHLPKRPVNDSRNRRQIP